MPSFAIILRSPLKSKSLNTGLLVTKTHESLPWVTYNSSMKLALVHTFLLCGVLLGQITHADDSHSFKHLMAITVTAHQPVQLHPAAGTWWPSDLSTVRVSKVELDGEDIRVRIENTTSVPVRSVKIQYAYISCFDGAKSTSHAGMASVDIPARGYTWYDDDRMASVLALSAAREKTRYLQVYASIYAAVFIDGSEAGFWDVGNRASEQPIPKVDDAVCQQYPWNDAPNSLRGFVTSDRKSTQSHARVEDGAVSYTCSAVGDHLHCPD